MINIISGIRNVSSTLLLCYYERNIIGQETLIVDTSRHPAISSHSDPELHCSAYSTRIIFARCWSYETRCLIPIDNRTLPTVI